MHVCTLVVWSTSNRTSVQGQLLFQNVFGILLFTFYWGTLAKNKSSSEQDQSGWHVSLHNWSSSLASTDITRAVVPQSQVPLELQWPNPVGDPMQVPPLADVYPESRWGSLILVLQEFSAREFPCHKQTEVLPFKSSQTVISLGTWKCAKELGYLFAHFVGTRVIPVYIHWDRGVLAQGPLVNQWCSQGQTWGIQGNNPLFLPLKKNLPPLPKS